MSCSEGKHYSKGILLFTNIDGFKYWRCVACGDETRTSSGHCSRKEIKTDGPCSQPDPFNKHFSCYTVYMMPSNDITARKCCCGAKFWISKKHQKSPTVDMCASCGDEYRVSSRRHQPVDRPKMTGSCEQHDTFYKHSFIESKLFGCQQFYYMCQFCGVKYFADIRVPAA